MPGDFALAFVLLFLIWAGALAFFIWALVDAIRVPDDALYRSGSKVVWILVIVFLGPIGAIISLAAGRPPREARGATSTSTRFAGAVGIDYRGLRYVLGRTANQYVIWDTAAGGAPVRTYPLDDAGWAQAWQAYYHQLEGAPPPPAARG